MAAASDILATPPGFTPEEWTVARTLIDPVAFSKQWLNVDLWRVQQEILRSVATRPRTRVKTCHASGKSRLSAVAALWWMTRFPDGVVITTAPSWLQVEKVLWGEIHNLLHRSRIKYPEPRKTELFNRADNYVLGMSTNEGVRFQGFHGRVLIIYDEAPGVNPEIYEAVEGIRAGGDVRELSVGNPVIASGPFYDGFSAQRTQFGDGLFTISAFDTPNLEGLTLRDLLTMSDDDLDVAPWPMLTTRRWVHERFFAWGGSCTHNERGELVITEPTHPAWASRVMGEFPSEADNQLISLTLLEAAKKRAPVDDGGPVVIGLDVAGPGEDETVLTAGNPRNGAVLKMRAWPDPDPRGAVLNELEQYRGRVEVVNVDADGIGYYFAKYIEDQGFPVKRIHVGLPSSNPRRFKNRKAQYYWGIRERAQDGDLAGLTDDLTISQLQALTFTENARGQIEIESKDSLRGRGVKSPDRAESLMLAFCGASRSRISSIEVGSAADEPDDEERERSPYASQFASSPIGAEFRAERGKDRDTCGGCQHFKPSRLTQESGRCELRMMNTQRAAPECDYFEPQG